MMLNIILVIIELSFILILIDGLAGKEAMVTKRKIYQYGLLFIVLTSVYFQGIDYFNLPNLVSLLAYIGCLLYVKGVYGKSMKETVLIFLTAASIGIVLELIFVLPFLSLAQGVVYETAQNIIVNTLCLLSALLLHHFVKLQYLIVVLKKRETIYSIVAVGLVAILGYFLIAFKLFQQFQVREYLLIVGFMIILTLVIFVWQKNMMTARQAYRELEIRMLYEDAFDELVSEVRARQHEFDNHITAILSQQYTNRTYEDLVEAQGKYCETLKEGDRYYQLLQMKNTVLGGFLYSKLSRMSECGIVVEYEMVVDSMDMRIPVVKLIEVLGTLIDNSVEAVQNKNVKKIYVSIIEQEDKIDVQVRNVSEFIPHAEVVKFMKRGFSTKSADGKRGLGLYNLKKIVKSYQGEVRIGNLEIENEMWIMFQITMIK